MVLVVNKDWNPSQKEREKMPAHAFLLPSQKKFPYKINVNGQRAISCKMLKDALFLANQHGYKKISRVAKAYIKKYCKNK